MRDIDSVFSSEFREMMNGRRALIPAWRLVDLPLPTLPTMHLDYSNKLAKVNGLREQFFERLNGTEVKLVGRTSLQKRQVLSDGSFRRDDKGNFMYIQVPVKQGFVAVVSPISIGLRRFIEVDGVRKKHEPTPGFRYVDYIETNGRREYIYIIPKENVYPLELCALVITPNTHRLYYKGCRLALQNGTYLYMYVIPYKYRESPSYRILGVKASVDFDAEVSAIFQHWVKNGILFNLCLTALANQVNGVTNLGIMNLVGTCDYTTYIPCEFSLAEMKDEYLPTT